MSEAFKIKTLFLIMVVGILFTSLNSTPLVNAQPTKTSLTITVPYNPPWTACTIEAILKDENGNPLQNFDIDFLWAHRLDDGSLCGEHWLGDADTNSKGAASLTYTFWSSGTYNITAKFSGSPEYAPSSSEYIDIIIVDYSQYLVGGGLIAVVIIGVLGYIVFRRRKKAITMLKTTKET